MTSITKIICSLWNALPTAFSSSSTDAKTHGLAKLKLLAYPAVTAGIVWSCYSFWRWCVQKQPPTSESRAVNPPKALPTPIQKDLEPTALPSTGLPQVSESPQNIPSFSISPVVPAIPTAREKKGDSFVNFSGVFIGEPTEIAAVVLIQPESPLVIPKQIEKLQITQNHPSLISSSPPLAPVEKSPTFYETAFIGITTSGGGFGGYIGDPSICRSFCPALTKFTLEDGTLIPLDPQDILIQFSLFNQFSLLLPKQIRSTLYLPYKFLRDKQENAPFRLKYNGISLEFAIDQLKHPDKHMRKPFQDMLASTVKNIKEKNQIENPLFGVKYDPTWFYKLGNNGHIYKSVKTDNHWVLQQRSASDFRPKADPKFAAGTVVINKTHCTYTCSMPMIQLEDIDIIHNDTFLIIYDRTKLQDFPCSNIKNAPLVHSNTCDEDTTKALQTGEREWIFAMSWDHHPELSQLKKEQLLEGTLSYTKGILQFTFPLLKPAAERILFSTTSYA